MVMSASDRNKYIRAIHAGAREVGLSSENRKLMQLKLVGKESCVNMSITELKKVSEHLKSLAQTPKNTQQTAKHRHHRLVYALWWDLGIMGGLGKGWKSLSREDRVKMLNGFVKRLVKIDHLEWTTPSQARVVAESIKARIERAKK